MIWHTFRPAPAGLYPDGLSYPYVSYEVSRDLEVQHLRARCESLERELQNAKKLLSRAPGSQEAYEAKVMEEDSKRREMDALRIIRPTQEQVSERDESFLPMTGGCSRPCSSHLQTISALRTRGAD
eukprot:192540-Hanusia_phi.AAC.1